MMAGLQFRPPPGRPELAGGRVEPVAELPRTGGVGGLANRSQ